MKIDDNIYRLFTVFQHWQNTNNKHLTRSTNEMTERARQFVKDNEDLVKNIGVISSCESDSEQLCVNCQCKPTQKLGFCNECFDNIYSRA